MSRDVAWSFKVTAAIVLEAPRRSIVVGGDAGVDLPYLAPLAFVDYFKTCVA